mgnify:CR=1 FL=1
MPQQWVIPDTHGYLKTLRALLEEQIRPSKFDEIYSVSYTHLTLPTIYSV